MLDGTYQSVMVFFIPYLTVINSSFITFNGQDISDRLRLGCYIAHPAVLTINSYILINCYRWDWIILLVVAISDLFIFFWTGVYTSTTYSGSFYKAGAECYSEATFWACFFITPVICLFPRFAIKSLQKVYFPYDVDIVREQVTLGMFDKVIKPEVVAESFATSSAGSCRSSRKSKHVQYASVDDDQRPIYPPSVATHNTRAQNGSDGTNYTGHEDSIDNVPQQRTSADLPDPPALRPSVDRPRPSYDRIRASMDRVRPSYEQSSDFTSAARLSRVESSQSGNHVSHSLFNRSRLRGMSIISAKSRKE